MGVRVILLIITFGATLYCALAMPWAELDMDPTAIPHTLKLLHIEKAGEVFDSLYGAQKQTHKTALETKKAEGKHGEYVYSLVLGVALLTGAIGIMAIGSGDDEEKMIVPTK